MLSRWVGISLLIVLLASIAVAQDGGGDFSVSSSDNTYTNSNGCSMGYCDTAFGSSTSSAAPIDLSAWDGVSQRFVDGLQSSQITWQDGVPMLTSGLQSEAGSLQSALSALAGVAEEGTNAALNTVAPGSSSLADAAGQVLDPSALQSVQNALASDQAQSWANVVASGLALVLQNPLAKIGAATATFGLNDMPNAAIGAYDRDPVALLNAQVAALTYGLAWAELKGSAEAASMGTSLGEMVLAQQVLEASFLASGGTKQQLNAIELAGIKSAAETLQPGSGALPLANAVANFVSSGTAQQTASAASDSAFQSLSPFIPLIDAEEYVLSSGSGLPPTSASTYADTSVQDWMMMQQMIASLNQSKQQPTVQKSPTTAGLSLSTPVPSTNQLATTTTTTGSKQPNGTGSLSGASSNAPSTSSSSGLCPNPAAVASVSGPAPGHNVTSASSPSCPGCVISSNAPSDYIPLLIPCSQVAATPVSKHAAVPRNHSTQQSLPSNSATTARAQPQQGAQVSHQTGGSPANKTSSTSISQTRNGPAQKGILRASSSAGDTRQSAVKPTPTSPAVNSTSTASVHSAIRAGNPATPTKNTAAKTGASPVPNRQAISLAPLPAPATVTSSGSGLASAMVQAQNNTLTAPRIPVSREPSQTAKANSSTKTYQRARQVQVYKIKPVQVYTLPQVQVQTYQPMQQVQTYQPMQQEQTYQRTPQVEQHHEVPQTQVRVQQTKPAPPPPPPIYRAPVYHR